MTDEPYRWLEAIGNRREYVQGQLEGGSPVFALSLPDGILLVGVGTGQSKVFEIHDRLALAGLGHPADLERLRQSLIDAAHLEAFTRASEDVALRRLVSFGLGPQLKTAFEQIFSPPFLARLLLAEVGPHPEADTLVRLAYDGSYHLQHGGLLIAADDPAREGAAQKWLAGHAAQKSPVGDAPAGSLPPLVDRILECWWCLTQGVAPGSADASAGWRAEVRGRSIEVGWLSRGQPRAAYRSLAFGAP